MLVDAGPNGSVADCLGTYMPYFDHTIDLAFITHPQKDHYYGYTSLLQHYEIKTIITTPFASSNTTYNKLIQDLKTHHAEVHYINGETSIRTAQANIYLVWPTQLFIESVGKNNKNPHSYTLNDPNDSSIVIIVEINNTSIFLTGDLPIEYLENVSFPNQNNTRILKVSHHGSKTGTSIEFLKSINPTLSVISVGKNNRYHHPSAEVLAMFKELGLKYRRTDEEGNIRLYIK